MKSLKTADLKGKTVLLRVDINCPVINGRVLMSDRIKSAAKTISFLKKKNAKIVVIAHQGRPGSSDFTHMGQHAKFISKFTKVGFIKDIIGEKAENSIKSLKPKEAILLDNVRLLKEEFSPGKNKMVNFFSGLCDFYVNDAFSDSHRNHTSIVSFPMYLPSFMGPSLENELVALKAIHVKNSIYILGGEKPEDNIKLLDRAETILSTGIFALYCLIAKGKRLGKQEEILRKKDNFEEIIIKIKKRIHKIQTPVDLAINVKGLRKEIPISELPAKYPIPDLGTETIKIYAGKIKNAKFVFMKGPAGNTTIKGFEKATFGILRAISDSKAFSLIGGGHLNEALSKSKISKNKFSHISLSGGALISYIAGEKLPGIEALKRGLK